MLFGCLLGTKKTFIDWLFIMIFSWISHRSIDEALNHFLYSDLFKCILEKDFWWPTGTTKTVPRPLGRLPCFALSIKLNLSLFCPTNITSIKQNISLFFSTNIT
jgi:hypothetical protein